MDSAGLKGSVGRMGIQKFDRIVLPAFLGVCVFSIHKDTFSKLFHSGDRFLKIAFSMRIRVDGT